MKHWNKFECLLDKLIFIIIILLGVSGCQQPKKISYGVWANRNCELVVTEKCMLFFEYTDSVYQSFCICEDLSKGSPNIFAKAVFKDTLIERCFQMKIAENYNFRHSITYPEPGMLDLKFQGDIYRLQLVEEIVLTEPYEMFFAHDSTIGHCLQQWMLGSRVDADTAKRFIRCSIGTNKHSYMFDFNNEFTYCRAARIRSNNQGTLFSQNFRLWSRDKEQKAFIAKPNDKETSQPLSINDSLFTKGSCFYDSKGIYWSLVKFEEDKIWVNGCGEEYRFDRPSIHQNLLTEWFLFDKY